VLDHWFLRRPFLRVDHDVFSVDDLDQYHRLGDVRAGSVELDGPEKGGEIGGRDRTADLIRIEVLPLLEGISKDIDRGG
jgi:hypothetical protein